MKRLWNQVALTANQITYGISCRSMPIAVAIAAVASVLSTANSAQAFGGHHGGGERIVNSQVVSDVAVGESYGEEYEVGGQGASGGVVNREYGQPDLFYNFYTQGGANRANAQMYVSPVPVPPNVGHTSLTYQPFYPHEMLYPHTDKFHNYYDNGRGMNRTRVNYSTSPIQTGIKNFYWNVLRIPR